MGLIYCPKTTSGSNITTQNDSAGISYNISYKQQIKVQILTLQSSKIFQKNENVRKMPQQQQQQAQLQPPR